MNFVYFFLVSLVQGRLEEALIELNKQYETILGTFSETYALKETLITGYLRSDLGYCISILNNTLESSLELHYFEFSNDFVANLAHYSPQLEIVFNASVTKTLFERIQNETFSRFGVISTKSHKIQIEDKIGNTLLFELSESLVYTQKEIFKVVTVLNATQEIYFAWNYDRVKLKDQHFPYRVFICPFLLGIVLSITFLYCFNSYRKKFPCVSYSEFSDAV